MILKSVMKNMNIPREISVFGFPFNVETILTSKLYEAKDSDVQETLRDIKRIVDGWHGR